MFDDDPRWGSDPRERDDYTRDRDAVDPRDVFVTKLEYFKQRRTETLEGKLSFCSRTAFSRRERGRTAA